MNWLIENWYLVVAGLAVVAVILYLISGVSNMPDEEQKKKIHEWLVWACIEAERALQSGTGQLKLREVWNLFCAVPAFTWVAKIVTFETFSNWVSESLVEVKTMLVNNPNLAEYVYGNKAADEVAKIKAQLGVDG